MHVDILICNGIACVTWRHNKDRRHVSFSNSINNSNNLLSYFSAQRLSNFYIDVTKSTNDSFPQQCAFDPVPFTASETRVYICQHGTIGKIVRIRFDSNYSEFLQLCEVQVQGGTK